MKKASAVTLLILIGILTCCLGAFGCSALIGLSSVIGWFFALLLLTGHITGAAYAFRLFKTRSRLAFRAMIVYSTTLMVTSYS